VGGVPFARVRYLVEWHTTGNLSRAKPVQSTVSAYTVNTVFSSALFNGGNQQPAGSMIAACGMAPTPAAGAHVMRSYPGDGCGIWDNQRRRSIDHNHVVQTSWTFSDRPGYWYVLVRSPVSRDPDKVDYRFNYATDLAQGSVAGGWNP
jgi:hypothetical protein